METSDLKGVKELEAENAKLKWMYAVMALENMAMKYLIAKRYSATESTGFGDLAVLASSIIDCSQLRLSRAIALSSL
jgi:hypothetical protein